MKQSFIFAIVLLAHLANAQTNSAVFPQLLSSSNAVLMTNAEFRCFAGNKIFFKNDFGYKSFLGTDLNTNVLAALHTSTAQLEAQQKQIDASKQKFNEASEKQAAEAQRKQEWLKENTGKGYSVANAYDATNGRTGWDGKSYHDNQSEGNFMGN